MRIVTVLFVISSVVASCTPKEYLRPSEGAEEITVTRAQICQPDDRLVFVPDSFEACERGYYATLMEQRVLGMRQRPDLVIEISNRLLRNRAAIVAPSDSETYARKRKESFEYFRQMMTQLCYAIMSDPCSEELRQKKHDFFLNFANQFIQQDDSESEFIKTYQEGIHQIVKAIQAAKQKDSSDQQTIQSIQQKSTTALAELVKRLNQGPPPTSVTNIAFPGATTVDTAREERQELRGLIDKIQSKLETVAQEVTEVKCAVRCPSLDLVVDSLQVSPAKPLTAPTPGADDAQK